MRVSFKEIVWYNVNIPIDKEELVLKEIQNGNISCSRELHDNFDISGIHDIETSKELSIENNEGDTTIEIYNSEGKELYTNSKK